MVKAAAQLGHEVPKSKIKGERPATAVAEASVAEAPSRRPLLIGAVSAVAALAIAAMIWLVGNPHERPGRPVEPPEPPAPAVAASAEALPAPADMPVPR